MNTGILGRFIKTGDRVGRTRAVVKKSAPSEDGEECESEANSCAKVKEPYPSYQLCKNSGHVSSRP